MQYTEGKQKKYIFYTSRPEYVSTVIDQVPLLIILNTSGSFPSMAPLKIRTISITIINNP